MHTICVLLIWSDSLTLCLVVNIKLQLHQFRNTSYTGDTKKMER